LESLKVRHVMTYDVVTIEDDYTIKDTARLMVNYNINNVVIMKGEEILGTLTDREIIDYMLDEELDPHTTKVGDIVKETVYLVRPNTPLARAAEIMESESSEMLPVVDEELIGVVLQEDVAMINPELFKKQRILQAMRRFNNWV
jgi:CBS domain-containing protein